MLPNPHPKPMPYLSIIPDRRPIQKLHANVGHAKNAINGRGGPHGALVPMQVYEYVDNDWVLLYDIKKGDVEPPWRAGELEAKRKREVAAAQRADVALRREASRLGTLSWLGMDKEEHDHQEIYTAGFVAGYLARGKK